MSRLFSLALTASGLVAMAVALFGCSEYLDIEINSELPADDETILMPETSFVAVEPAVALAPKTRSAIRVAYASVAVTLDGDLAKTVITEVLVNDLTSEAEATFRFPLPNDATVTDFAHFKDGVRVGAAIGGKEEARAEYERAVGSGEKAALAEESEGRHFEMTLAPIAASGQRRIELSYTQTLTALGGERIYALPARHFSQDLPTLLDVDVEIRGSRALAAAQAVNHPDARIVRHSEDRMTVHLARSRAPLGRDFVVTWNQPTSELELDGRMALRPGKGGQFAEIRFAFNRDPDEATRPASSVVLVIDHSLSMAGAPLAHAQELAAGILDDLGPNDRVGFVGFANDVSTRTLGPATAGQVNAIKADVASLMARGHSSLSAALDEAAQMVAGQPGPLIVIASDGQATVGDDFADEAPVAKPVDVSGARVLVAHFNYPSRSGPISGLFPKATVHFVPDGDAGDNAIASLTKLAVAPTIDDLAIKVEGAAPGTIIGSIPDRLAMGESVRVLARGAGDLDVRVSGTLHGKPISMSAKLAREPTPSELGATLATEWARVRIAELERRYRGGETELSAEVRELGVEFRLATTFTSFVATDRADEHEPLDDYDADDDELSPDRIKPGDPEIRIRAQRSASRVFGVLPWGEIIECEWQEDEGLWLGRFLVPRETADGLYKIRVFVSGQESTKLRGTLLYRVDSAPPRFELTANYTAGVLALVATPVAEVFDTKGDSVRFDRVDLKRIVVRVGSGVTAREIELRADGEQRWVATTKVELPVGAHQLTLTATDYAANSSQTKTTVRASR